MCVSLAGLALSVTACAEHLGCAPYGRHTLIRCAHPSGQPAAVTPLRYVSLLAQERCAKEGHPDIRVSLRETSLAPALLRGPAYKGRPWPLSGAAVGISPHPCGSSPYATPPLGLLKGTWASSARSRFKSKSQTLPIFMLRRCRKLANWFPFRRPSGVAVEGVERHGCRESRDGPGMALHGVPLER